MVSLQTITYWCYITAVMFQSLEALGFIFNPTVFVSVATDHYAQFFVRTTGICLLPLTQVFWGFRHIPFQAQGGVDAQLAAYSHGAARLFAKFHTLVATLLFWAMFSANIAIPNGSCLLSLHLTWATIMTNILLQHHRRIHGRIVDTSSAPAALKSVGQLLRGDGGEEPRSVLQMIKGEDSSSNKSVMQMIQDEIKTD